MTFYPFVVSRVQYIRVETFVQATEDRSKVEKALESVVGEGLTAPISSENLEGIHHNLIISLRAEVKRDRDVRAVLERWSRSSFWQVVVAQAEQRLDDDMVLHARLDKQKSFLGELTLWNGGESIDVKIKIVTYPSSREEALLAVRELASGSDRKA